MASKSKTKVVAALESGIGKLDFGGPGPFSGIVRAEFVVATGIAVLGAPTRVILLTARVDGAAENQRDLFSVQLRSVGTNPAGRPVVGILIARIDNGGGAWGTLMPRVNYAIF